MAAKTVVPGSSEDLGKWVALALALIGVGLLPKRSERGLALAAAVIYLVR